MKKKAWIIAGVLTLCIVLGIVLGVFFWLEQYKLDADEIDRIALWNMWHTASSDLEPEDAARFIELFNEAQYAGKTRGYGTTPDWSVSVYFQDGSYYLISDFSETSGTVEISRWYPEERKETGFYVKNTELYDFILEMQEKYPQK